ncbi:hypothetical protein Tco_0138215 [Tanacetum coccineum]
MANTTPIVTTVTKTTTKEKPAKETDATPRVNILDFCEEHYEEILLVIMDKVRQDKRKEVHIRLDFRENYKKSRRMREGSQNSSARTLPARVYSSGLAVPTRQAQLGLDRNEKTLGIIPTAEVVPIDETLLLAGVILEIKTASTMLTNHIPAPPVGDKPHIDLTLATTTVPIAQKEEGEMNPRYLMCQRVTPVREDTGSINKKDASLQMKKTWRAGGSRKKFPSRGTGGMLGNAHVVPHVQFYPNRDRESMVNNLELTKRLNEPVPKTMEEMMTATTNFIRGETVAASKKKGHTSWKSQDQSKRRGSKRKSDFRGQLREGRGSNRFTHLTRTPKEILAAEVGKFEPPPPMVIPVEKSSSNKFCDFYNDKGTC